MSLAWDQYELRDSFRHAQVFLWPIYVETLGYDRITQYYCMILVALVEIPGLCLCKSISVLE